MPNRELNTELPEAFTSLLELQQAIDQIPLKSGCKRVYRGQTRDFEKMVPSGLRGQGIRDETTWLVYVQFLARELLAEEGVPEEQRDRHLRFWILWYYALSQHYGPGSNYLDVTHSLEVAVWFALHKPSPTKFVGTMGMDGPPSPDDVYRQDTWISHEEWSEAPGYIYVFDVPEWDGEGEPQHGELVDLAHAPSVFRRSTRMQIQAGCLILADREQGGDLKGCYTCAPLRARWPFSGSQLVKFPPNKIYPSPWDDPWYDRLLRLPLSLHQIDDEPGWCFQHPIPVNLYLPEPVEDYARIASRFVGLDPILLLPHQMQPALVHDGTVSVEEQFAARNLAYATAILLQAPLFSTTPPFDSDLWNQSLLNHGLPYMAGQSEDGNQEIPLDTVFIELSPLEKIGWHLVDKPNQPFEMLRAVYLSRRGDWQMRIWLQQQSRLISTPDFPIRFDAKGGQFEFQIEDQWHPVTDHPYVAKGLFVTLLLLRDLSTEAKPLPFPQKSLSGILKGKPHWEVSVIVTRDIAKLECIRNYKRWKYHHIRYRSNNAAYCGYTDSRNYQEEKAFGFGGNRPYSQVPLQYILDGMNR